ncbi:hypothetical protein VTL71DRAFT_9088 [Oculimacula yallundae]|uniref:Uncharacterized protein n=1 Tax=Oculimacula yallundae TaxID=86028 RepID=A0ABR4BV97_9HELO
MRISQIFSTLSCLASAVSAIDIYLYPHSACSGTYLVCRNANPGQCCRPALESDRRFAIGFRAIPLDWNIEGQAKDGWNCDGKTDYGYGSPNICIVHIGVGAYRGGVYYFRGKKARDETAVTIGNATETAACNPIRPDALGLANGTRYDISGLSDDSFSEMVCFNILLFRKYDADKVFYFNLAQDASQADALDSALHQQIHALKLRSIEPNWGTHIDGIVEST